MNFYTQLFSSHKINYKVPDNFNDSDRGLFYEINFVNTIPSVEMITLKNAFVSNKFVFKGLNLFYQFTSHNKVSVGKYLKSLIKKNTTSKQKINEAILGIQDWDHNYFHWMTETLPGIIAMYQLKKSPVLLNSNSVKVKHIINSLSLLHIPYIVHDIFNNTAQVSKLHLINVPKVAIYNEFLFKNMRELFFKKIEISNIKPPHRKLYISRQKARRRKILNESALIKLLKEFEFDFIYLEDYSLEEQIKILSETKVVVSSHGAGLTNIMFMNEGSTVIELKAKNNDYWCFFSLARLSKLHYNYLLCDSVEINHRNANIEIDLLKLKELLVRTI